MPRLRRTDLSKLIEPFEGQWVALTTDEKKVVGASCNLDAALKQAKAKGISLPLIIKSPSPELVGFFY